MESLRYAEESDSQSGKRILPMSAESRNILQKLRRSSDSGAFRENAM
jgi:hypothetical protein